MSMTERRQGRALPSGSRRQAKLGEQWDWMVQCYYKQGVTPPIGNRIIENDHTLAIETVHKGESSRDMEVAVAQAREDIGKIIVINLKERI